MRVASGASCNRTCKALEVAADVSVACSGVLRGFCAEYKIRRSWRAMNLIFRKDALQVNVILLLGCLLLTSSAVVWGDEINEGRELYLQHCAACHGVKGDGHGPLEHELAEPPADLRLLSRKYGNPLPEDQIARFMDGRADVRAHGPRDMPVWGEEIWQYPEGSGNPNQVSDSVALIIHYLQSIQIVGSHASREKTPSYAQFSTDNK